MEVIVHEKNLDTINTVWHFTAKRKYLRYVRQGILEEIKFVHVSEKKTLNCFTIYGGKII